MNVHGHHGHVEALRASSPAVSSLSADAIPRAILARAARPIGRLDDGAELALRVPGVGEWLLVARGGRIEVAPARAKPRVPVVEGDIATLVEVIQGTRSGVEAFLQGKLRARGDLALALKLDGWFERPTADARLPTSGVVDADGIPTFYLAAGQGTPVILLHGLACTNASMLPTFWDLAARSRVYAPDLPGFGASGKPRSTYDFPFFARWLEAFLRAVDLPRAHLVGNSMGGRIAIELCLRAPHLVDRLVLLTPSMGFLKWRNFEGLVRALPAELASLPLPLARRVVVPRIRSLFARPERVHPDWYEAAADEFLRVFRSPRGRVALFSAMRQIYLEPPRGADGFWDRLPALSRPALFLWGERDWLVPAKFARHVRAALPHQADNIVLDDCGHIPQYELPELTNRLTREFLRL